MIDREFLNWGGGEGENTKIDGMSMGNTSGDNDLVQWTTGNEVWEPGMRDINPS